MNAASILAAIQAATGLDSDQITVEDHGPEYEAIHTYVVTVPGIHPYTIREFGDGKDSTRIDNAAVILAEELATVKPNISNPSKWTAEPMARVRSR